MTSTRRLSWLGLAIAAIAILGVAVFDDNTEPTASERIQALSDSFACPECDGQSVAESNAAIAATIREDIRASVADGATDEEIRNRLIGAYGTDVLLTPPADGFSALVWILPVMVVVLGVAGLVFVVRRSSGRSRSATTEDQHLVARARAGTSPAVESRAEVADD